MVRLRGESPTHHVNQMKLINVHNAAAIVNASLISAQAIDAYPSITTFCTELRVELEKGMEEGQLKQEEVEQMLINCRDLQSQPAGKPDAMGERLKAMQDPQGKSRGHCDCHHPSLEKLKSQKPDLQKNDILGRR